MSIKQTIYDVENSDVIQNYKRQFAEAQAAGASEAMLIAIHEAAQAYRRQYGYEGNLDGSDYIVIGNTPAPQVITSAQENEAPSLSAGSSAAAAADLKIDTGSLATYGKYILIGLIGLTVLDGLFK